ASQAVATTAETRSHAPSAPAPPRAQSPPTPPQARAPGCATTPHQPQDDGCSAADGQAAARRHQTTPPAQAPQPQAKAGSPPPAPSPEDAPPPPPNTRPAIVAPPHAPRRIHRPSRRHLQLPFPRPRHRQPQTQRIVMINHSLQRQYQVSLAQPRRHLQQHRLIEPIERTTTLQKPAHDRRRRQSTSGNVRLRPGPLPDNAGTPGKPRNSLMLKHRTRRNHQPSLARTAHKLDRYDAVAPKREEVVVDPNTLQSQYLGKQPTQ